MSDVCSLVEGCGARVKARGLCRLYYDHFRGAAGFVAYRNDAPLCCVCPVPVAESVFGGGQQCKSCGRPCHPAFAEMRNAYLARLPVEAKGDGVLVPRRQDAEVLHRHGGTASSRGGFPPPAPDEAELEEATS